MGRPQADSSSYDQTDDQHQAFDLQPPEYTLEATQTQDDDNLSAHTYGTNYYQDTSQQDQDYQPNHYTDHTSPNDPQEQQQQQQPPPQQQQAQQYPPSQANQGYGGQPAQYPPNGPQTTPIYSNGPNRPAPYPPQGPQTNPTQPVQFPPQSLNQPAQYPPQGQQTSPAQPAQYPPPSPVKPAAYPPQGFQTLPNQPVQFPPQSPQMNPMYPGGPTQPAKYPPQGQQQMPQATPQPFPNAYQAPQGQPQVVQYPPKSPVNGIPLTMNQQQEGWKTGLFDCMEDPTNALITALFPCVTFGQVAEIVDNGQTTCTTNGMMYGMVAFCIAMPCLVSCGYRTKLRAKYGLIEDPAPDWLTHFLFEWCALCQEYRELQHRGLDPSIGWQGNITMQSMQQAQVGMVPPMNQRMMP